jgi:uncharacterized protein
MKLVLNKYLLSLIILFSINIIPVTSKSIEERLPAKPSRLVNNLSSSYPRFLSNGESQLLESKLASFANAKGIQISVLIIDDLLDLEANEYTTRIFNKWGIGEKKTNLGVLILIKPVSPRVIYIGTGYGSEAYLPDASCKRIIETIIKPSFKADSYYQGLNLATDTIMNAFDPSIKKVQEESSPILPLILLVFFVLLFIITNELFGRNNSSLTLGPSRRYRRGLDASDIALPLILGSSFRSHDSSTGFGGFGGGGFGGFGGGMGGGGGAGGSW